MTAGTTEQLQQATAQMQQTGIRRLMVLAGESEWSSQQVQMLSTHLPGDWLWVGASPELPFHCAPSAVRSMLGREFQHAVFDARSGLDAAALAALSGMLKAGSWLLLLTPDWPRWPALPDEDSSRWSDAPQAIPTPHFVSHLQRCIRQDPESMLWQQHKPFTLNPFAFRPGWQPASGAPEQEQAAILAELADMQQGVAVVTAARGRGKSALAGMLANRISGSCLVTAPAKAATDVLAGYAGEAFQFMAPDALAAERELPAYDWLIVDEAAAIPAPLLRQLTERFPCVLLTTTVQGYEGTGRGFLLKFCAALPSLRRFTLNTPIRWAQNDPLEQVVDRILLFDEPDLESFPQGDPELQVVEQADWSRKPGQLQQMYRLLSGAHYRTSPLDWRRMLDAPGQHFIAASTEGQCAGALWMVEEGGLDESLSRNVWAGFRRPRGNLVAQSLAAHGGSPLAATLRGLRISRIAVHPQRQREHIGASMIKQAQQAAEHRYDYLSVSFGYTEELWRFWQRCGFKLVRIGSHKEASSGCYSAMALLPLTPEGHALTNNEQQRLRRDWPWQRAWLELSLPLTGDCPQKLLPEDWQELSGFAFAHRPLEACLGALNRLLLASGLPLQALRGRLERRESSEGLSQRLGLSGKKALLALMREEARSALEHLDKARAEVLHNGILQLQKFH
ncbi:tRNA(Met) cytidine acetyltransferase TmcA [Cedecea lapagei]|uniref:tRNA(Met) cytidine acetyltransferase TmcA n=1 Tax=Cedecea lapagei TaxID=158823 RepID=A0A447UZD4_9ENTR|nr:GNAT family N-acetyltransferase [Cedecea lapagei]VEB96002.1 tRNA(Met) cytidine acetyltransferase TmcA [Cedecea lapagei]